MNQIRKEEIAAIHENIVFGQLGSFGKKTSKTLTLCSFQHVEYGYECKGCKGFRRKDVYCKCIGQRILQFVNGIVFPTFTHSLKGKCRFIISSNQGGKYAI